jgi:hypothetical protein
VFKVETEFLLRRMIMKRLFAGLFPVLMVVAGAYADGRGTPTPNYSTNVRNVNKLYSEQNQQQIMKGQGYATAEGGYATAEGGDASAGAVALSGDSSSGASVSIDTTSVSNYKTRTPPLTVFPPHLPYWNHGGWGTIKAYFPNGPNSDDQVYERIFDPDNRNDVRELRGVLESLPYDGPLDVFGGILNGVGVVFGGVDNYHHGRGFEIANSLVRTRRPRGKPLLVFIDSNVETNLLREAGYAYVGRVSLEGKVERNWDHVYDAAVAEALPWDVDILLVSGGMKGVTVGSNISFPGAGGGYSQANYSVSLFGSVSSGITEGKGKALVSAAGYRHWPAVVERRRIPKAFYERFHAKLTTKPATKPTTKPVQKTERPVVQKAAPQGISPVLPATRKPNTQGVEVSRQLYDMAGFDENQLVEYVIIK